MNYYVRALKKYADFKGRDTRPQFWYFYLIHFIISLILGVIDNFIGSEIFVGLYGLAVLIPTLAIMTRRLHDIGKSGWWILTLFLVPFGLFIALTIILLIVLAITGMTPDPFSTALMSPVIILIIFAYFIYLFAPKGENKPNKYGPVPGKEESRAENKNENQQ